MTPADGSDFSHVAGAARVMPAMRAVLLRGGVAIVFFEDADAIPPRAGRLTQDAAAWPWAAHFWRSGGGDAVPRWSGVAVLEAPPAPGAEVQDGATAETWRIAAAPRLDVSPEPLAEVVRRAGRDGEGVLAFLVDRLTTGRPEGAAGAHREFVRALVAAAAERDGFVELLGAPDTGGLFAQGWSMSLEAGPGALCAVAADLSGCEIEVAQFEREDVLEPARGVCLFGKFWRAEDAPADAIYFSRDGRLLRLDVVRDAPRLEGERATAHLGQMLPRLIAPEATRAALRRVCRPRFGGVDTLSGAAIPVAAALDAVLRAPDGALLVRGWLLDPLGRVERAVLKSTANLYARLDATWCALPRPDLVQGFAADPRFATLLDPSDAMHGFVAHAPARPEALEGAQVYLELVLDDGSCLFRPVTVTPFASGERLAQVLGDLAPSEAELPRLVEEHLAPFLASVPPVARRTGPDGSRRPIPLGGGPAAREVTAVIPFRAFEEVQPMLALLAGAPEADALDLALVASRRPGAAALGRLGPAFEFYGLRGSLTLAPEHDGFAARCDLGLAASDAPAALCWSPAALPKEPGWLERLRAEAAGLEVPGLISPALTYEDGSIHFGGGARDATGAICALSGYGPGWLTQGPPRRAATGAAQVALVDRAVLRDAGGFAGRLFGDAHAHVDLADRLQATGFATWCSGAVEFWLMDEPAEDAGPAFAAMVRRIDAALLGRRGRPIRERCA